MKQFLPRLIIPSTAAILILFSAARLPAQERGFYFRADLGGTLTGDTELKEFFGPVSSGSKVKFDPGARAGFAAGFQLTEWFAPEIETGVMANSIDSITEASRADAVL